MIELLNFHDLKTQINSVIELFEIDNGQLPNTIVLPTKTYNQCLNTIERGETAISLLRRETIYTLRTGRLLCIKPAQQSYIYSAISMDNWD